MFDRVRDRCCGIGSCRRLLSRAVGATVLTAVTFAGVSVSAVSAGAPPVLGDGPSVDADGNTVFQPASAVTAGRYIVQLEDGAHLKHVVADVAGDGVEVTGTTVGAVDVFTAALDAGEVAQLRGRDDVVRVERDQVVKATEVQDNPPSGLDRIDQRALPLDAKYSSGYTGAGVDVYVIDSGIRSTHQEFTGRLKDGWYADYGDGRGIEDCSGHGTHVAGIVGGTTSGVAKGVKIVPVKVLDCNGEGLESTVIAGINWVIDNHVLGQPAVANLSLGGPSSAILNQAVESMMADGITVVVAGGNDPTISACDQSPATVDDAITVAASTANDGRAWFSSPGSCNDLFAPGVEVRSADFQSDTGSVLKSGTSMAAPHVAGAAALILQRHPTYNREQVWETMDREATMGVIAEAGADEPDKLLHVAPGLVPAAPTGLIATVAPGGGLGSDQIKLIWTAPATSGGDAVTDYVIKRSTHPYFHFTVVADGVSAAPTVTMSGLTTGTTYYFMVSAINSAGVSSWTSTVSAAPAAVPAAPHGLTAEVWPTPGLAAGNLRLRWSVPASNGTPISDYVIESSLDGTTWTTVNDPAWAVTAHTVIGLTGGASYSFRVAAVNSVGPGPWSATVTAIPATEPDAPTGLTAAVAPTAGVSSGEVQLAWTAPPNRGAAITDYLIQSSLDGTTWTEVDDPLSTATTFKLSNLPNGAAKQFRVAAKNGVGTSPWSSTIEATPIGTPTAPMALTAAVAPTAGVAPGQAQFTWTAPSDDGGAPITDYRIQLSIDGGSWTTLDDGVSTAPAATVGDLAGGTSRQFRIAAVNAAGVGPWSDTVTVTPVDIPAAPGGLTAAVAPAAGLGSGQVNLSWTEPADGGLTIVDYLVESSLDGSTWTTLDDGVSTATTFRVTGLADGTGYRFRVAAVNSLGAGTWTTPITATPTSAPAPPGGLKAAVAPAADVGSGAVRLNWTAPSSNGAAITDYLIQRSTNGTTWTTVTDRVSSATTFTVTGLANGTTYRFRTAAVNAAGSSAWSAPIQATPRWKPAAPGGMRVTAGSRQVTVTWTAPSSNGARITDYVIQRAAIGKPWATLRDGVSTARSRTISHLTNGTTYRIRVAAKNAVGVGGWSTAVRATPRAR